MRRLPIFFLIDVSESMVGEPIRNVNDGIKMIMSGLKSNPMALETVYISIIAFAGKVKTIVPLTYILDFIPHDLPIGGGTALGKAMNYLMDEINKQVQKTTYERKGDWKPIVFLLTDGCPTDQCASAIKRWSAEFKNRATLVAIAMANQVDINILREFTKNVFMFKNTDTKTYKDFFKWISSSIEMKSKNVVTDTSNEFEVQKLGDDIIKYNEKKRRQIYNDDNFVILLSRCQDNKKLYLIKYVKESGNIYNIEGSYKITEEYFEFSDEQQASTVQAQNLLGTPVCPYCGSQYGGMCACGKIMCIKSNVSYNKCPWCGQEGYYEVGAADFDVSRTQG